MSKNTVIDTETDIEILRCMCLNQVKIIYDQRDLINGLKEKLLKLEDQTKDKE